MKLWEKVKSIFSKKTIVVGSRPNFRKYFMGGIWGNQIGWADPREFANPGYYFTVYGEKDPLPIPGDVLFYRNPENKIAIFIFTDVKKFDKSDKDGFIARVGFSQFIETGEELNEKESAIN